MSRLIINNQEIKISPSKPIARTLQVNDISSLANRQANFTPTISVPRVAENIKAFQNLGIIGVNSPVPYQRNECYYYSESGEALIYKGWAIISATAKDFKVNLYDGNIDLYKAIENKSLSDLPLEEINHIKTLDNVIDSFNGLTTYKYILADYNGKALYTGGKINIDYLVPSVPVSYLWDKIFDFYGFTYEGSIFNTFAFDNLWMTFPKGVGSTLPDVAVYESDDLNFIRHSIKTTLKSTYLIQNSNTLNNLDSIFKNIHFKPTQSGLHRIEIGGKIRASGHYDFSSLGGSILNIPVKSEIWLAKNSDAIANSDNVVLLQLLQSNIGSDRSSISTELNINSIVNIDNLDSFCIVIRRSGNQSKKTLSRVIEDEPITLTISKVYAQDIDFSEAFIDFETKYFLDEILTRFSLTPFKDKYTNHYKFLTLQERLQDADVIDWSSKFIEVTNEAYVHGGYAQKNNFIYKYNDKEDDYYNGSILIDNVNLPDNKAVITSKIYAPERTRSNELQKETNVYKLWNKEVKDDGTVTYKSLDKRFYFLREQDYIFPSLVTIGSEILGTETTIVQAPFESYFKLPFNDIIQDFYLPISQILNSAKLLDTNFYITETDIVNIDFSKLYWVEQLGSYFILNKVSNFVNNGIVKCELIKVDYTPIVTGINPFQITISYINGFIVFSGYDASYPIISNFSTNDGVTFQYGAIFTTSNDSFSYPTLVPVLVRYVDLQGNIISNTIEILP